MSFFLQRCTHFHSCSAPPCHSQQTTYAYTHIPTPTSITMCTHLHVHVYTPVSHSPYKIIICSLQALNCSQISILHPEKVREGYIKVTIIITPCPYISLYFLCVVIMWKYWSIELVEDQGTNKIDL